MGYKITREGVMVFMFGFFMGTVTIATILTWVISLEIVMIGLGRPI